MHEDDERFAFLLVDDERSMITSLKRTFLEDHYELYTAGSGEAALNVLRMNRVDGALIDLRMPGMDGLT